MVADRVEAVDIQRDAARMPAAVPAELEREYLVAHRLRRGDLGFIDGKPGGEPANAAKQLRHGCDCSIHAPDSPDQRDIPTAAAPRRDSSSRIGNLTGAAVKPAGAATATAPAG